MLATHAEAGKLLDLQTQGHTLNPQECLVFKNSCTLDLTGEGRCVTSRDLTCDLEVHRSPTSARSGELSVASRGSLSDASANSMREFQSASVDLTGPGRMSVGTPEDNCEWMFADAATGALGFNALSHLNPMRWSGAVSLERGIASLEAVHQRGPRPVLLKLPANTLKHKRFETPHAAINYIRNQALSAVGSDLPLESQFSHQGLIDTPIASIRGDAQPQHVELPRAGVFVCSVDLTSYTQVDKLEYAQQQTIQPICCTLPAKALTSMCERPHAAMEILPADTPTDSASSDINHQTESPVSVAPDALVAETLLSRSSESTVAIDLSRERSDATICMDLTRGQSGWSVWSGRQRHDSWSKGSSFGGS